MRNMDFEVGNTKFAVENTKFAAKDTEGSIRGEKRRPGAKERIAAAVLSLAVAFGGGVALDAQDAHADKQQKETERSYLGGETDAVRQYIVGEVENVEGQGYDNSSVGNCVIGKEDGTSVCANAYPSESGSGADIDVSVYNGDGSAMTNAQFTSLDDSSVNLLPCGARITTSDISRALEKEGVTVNKLKAYADSNGDGKLSSTDESLGVYDFRKDGSVQITTTRKNFETDTRDAAGSDAVHQVKAIIDKVSNKN